VCPFISHLILFLLQRESFSLVFLLFFPPSLDIARTSKRSSVRFLIHHTDNGTLRKREQFSGKQSGRQPSWLPLTCSITFPGQVFWWGAEPLQFPLPSSTKWVKACQPLGVVGKCKWRKTYTRQYVVCTQHMAVIVVLTAVLLLEYT